MSTSVDLAEVEVAVETLERAVEQLPASDGRDYLGGVSNCRTGLELLRAAATKEEQSERLTVPKLRYLVDVYLTESQGVTARGFQLTDEQEELWHESGNALLRFQKALAR